MHPEKLIAFMLYQGQLQDYVSNLLNSFTVGPEFLPRHHTRFRPSFLESMGQSGEVVGGVRVQPVQLLHRRA